METIMGMATPMRNFGQVDLIHGSLSLQRRDFFRLLIALLGGLNQAPVSVNTAIEGMCFVFASFEDSIVKQPILSRELKLLHTEIANADLPTMPHFTVRKKRKKWMKWQLFEYVSLLVNSQSQRDLKYVGIYLFCLLREINHSKQVPAILFKYLESKEAHLSEKELSALHRMELNAKLHLADQQENLTDSFVEKIGRHFHRKIHYADAKTRQSAYDRKTYSPGEFGAVCQQLKSMTEDKALSKAACPPLLAMMTNLPVNYIYEIPIFEHVIDEWGIALSISEGIIYFDLSIIAPGAVDLAGEQFVPSSRILVKPMPLFLAMVLKEYLSRAPQTVRTIGDLIGNDVRLPEISPAKLANTYAKYASDMVD